MLGHMVATTDRGLEQQQVDELGRERSTDHVPQLRVGRHVGRTDFAEKVQQHGYEEQKRV